MAFRSRRIYVASSWRNPFYETTTEFLKLFGHEILDWRKDGFSWTEVTEIEKSKWTGQYYRDFVLQQPRAIQGFQNDLDKMKQADCCVLLLPCGRSAHLEAGWFAAQHNKELFIFIPIFEEPELMYKTAKRIVFTLPELTEALEA